MSNGQTVRRLARRKEKILSKILMALFLALFFGWLGNSLLNNVVVPQLINLENPRYGIIQERVDVQGTFVFSEEVIVAPQGGKVRLLTQEGERVRLGAPVAQITAPTIENDSGRKTFPVRAPVTGLVSYRLDGLEKVLTPQNLHELDLAKIDTLKGNPANLSQGDQVAKGDIIGKIINNLDSVFIFSSLEKGALEAKYLVPGKCLQLQFKGEENLAYWQVKEAKAVDDHYLIILENRRFQEDFLNSRQVSFGIVTKRFEGYILPVGALVKRGKHQGVYIKHKESLRWKPVEVTGAIGEKVAVKGLSPETEYAVNPSLAREGQPVR